MPETKQIKFELCILITQPSQGHRSFSHKHEAVIRPDPLKVHKQFRNPKGTIITSNRVTLQNFINLSFCKVRLSNYRLETSASRWKNMRFSFE